VNLEFWHFDCSAIETAHRVVVRIFRSAIGARDSKVSNRSFSSVPDCGVADASQRCRTFSGNVSSLRVLQEDPTGCGSIAPGGLSLFFVS